MKIKAILVAPLLIVGPMFSAASDGKLAKTFDNIPDMVGSPLDAAALKQRVNQEFDVQQVDVAQFMVAKMNELPVRGEKSANEVLKSLMEAEPEKTLVWMLDHFPELNVYGRAQFIDTLRSLKNYSENFLILVTFWTTKQR